MFPDPTNFAAGHDWQKINYLRSFQTVNVLNERLDLIVGQLAIEGGHFPLALLRGREQLRVRFPGNFRRAEVLHAHLASGCAALAISSMAHLTLRFIERRNGRIAGRLP